MFNKRLNNISSELSKIILNQKIKKQKINYKKYKITHLKKEIENLKKNYSKLNKRSEN